MRLTALPDWTPGPHPTVGLEVVDMRAAVAELRARGAAFEIYDGYGQDADGVWTAPGGGAQVAWFKDCAGNLLSLSARGG